MPYLDPHQVAAFADAERSAPLPVKVLAAQALIAEVLRMHDAAFRVMAHLDPLVARTGAKDRRARKDLMGDPVRYAELVWAGRQNGDGVGYDPGLTIAHDLRVLVYYGVGIDTGNGSRAPETAAEALAVAQAWHAAMEGEGVYAEGSWTSPPGLLVALSRQLDLDYTASDGTVWGVSLSLSDVRAGYAMPDATNPQDARFECVFTLTIT